MLSPDKALLLSSPYSPSRLDLLQLLTFLAFCDILQQFPTHFFLSLTVAASKFQLSRSQFLSEFGGFLAFPLLFSVVFLVALSFQMNRLMAFRLADGLQRLDVVLCPSFNSNSCFSCKASRRRNSYCPKQHVCWLDAFHD